MKLDYLVVLAGVAVAVLLERVVLAGVPATNTGPGAKNGRLEMRPLAWQGASGRALVARAFAIAALGTVLVAVLRFEGIEVARVAMIGVALLACAATDLLAYRVPDAVTIPALACAIVCSAVGGQPELVSAVAAAAMAGGLLLAAAVLTRGGLGGGDVKLGAVIGASLGLPVAAFALATGIVLGGVAVIGLYVAGRLGRDQAFPFAPFLALAGLAFLLVL